MKRIFVKTIKIGSRSNLVVRAKQFDFWKPETLPRTIKEFMELTNIQTEHEILEFILLGYNQVQIRDAKRIGKD